MYGSRSTFCNLGNCPKGSAMAANDRSAAAAALQDAASTGQRRKRLHKYLDLNTGDIERPQSARWVSNELSLLRRRPAPIYLRQTLAKPPRVRHAQPSNATLQDKDMQAASDVFLQPTLPLPEWTANCSPLNKTQSAACELRNIIDTRMPNPNSSCCVCSRLLPVLTAKYNPNPPSAISLAVNNIPNLHFLAKIPSDAVLQSFPADRYPRHGVTTFTHNGEDYCLDPSGISADGTATICPDCHSDLSHPKNQPSPTCRLFDVTQADVQRTCLP